MKNLNSQAVQSASTWEGTFPDLRKRARQLENEIDSKLLNLNKLGVGVVNDPLARLNLRYGVEASSSEKVPLYSTQSTFNVLSVEIEQLLMKLTEINDQMSAYVGSAGNASSNPALMHTMQRHRDIMQDYCLEFRRMQSNINARMEREQLMSSTKKEETSDTFPGPRDDLYMKEHDHIRSSDRLIEDQISIAISTKDHLNSQRSGLKGISKKIHQLTKKYPAINSVMQKINWRKRRDTIILGAVISVCLILMFIYATR